MQLRDFLLHADGSKTPLVFPGLPFYNNIEPPVVSFGGLNNNDVTVAGDTAVGQSQFSSLRSLDGHYRAIVCPDAVGASLSAVAVNDNNVVVGVGVIANDGVIATPTGVSPHVQLSTSNWTFGSHVIGQQSGPGRVFLSNAGPADLHIPTIYVGANQSNNQSSSFQVTRSNCTVGEHFQPNTIPSGGSCYVEFAFTPQYPGWQTATIYIFSDAPDSPQAIQVGGTGIGSALQLSNASWTFAAHRVGETSGNAVIYAYNGGPAPITFQLLHLQEEGDLPDFNLLSDTCSPELQPYKTCALTFNFAPATAGEHKATLYLGDNSGHGPLHIPMSGYAY